MTAAEDHGVETSVEGVLDTLNDHVENLREQLASTGRAIDTLVSSGLVKIEGNLVPRLKPSDG